MLAKAQEIDPIQQQLHHLRSQFIAGLPQRMDQILQASNQTERLFHLHRLTGASACYEMDKILRASKEAELTCSGNDLSLTELDAALNRLVDCVKTVTSGTLA